MKPSDIQALVNTAVDRLVAAQGKGWVDYAVLAIGVLTFLVLVRYTWETYKLRVLAQNQVTETDKLLTEAQRQNKLAQEQNAINAELLAESQAQSELSVQPMFAVHINRPLPNVEPQVMLANVGRGPAFNISIITMPWADKKLEIKNQTNVMRPSDGEPLVFHLLQDGRLNETIHWASRLAQKMDGRDIPNPLRIYVRCDDLKLKFYEFWFDCEATAEGVFMISFIKMTGSRKKG